MAEPFIGEIRMFGLPFAPQGWADADGQLLSIAENSALFSLYGTTYGGDGRTTFGLPDLRGRVPIHTGQGPGLPPFPQGGSGGSPSVALRPDQLARHTHPTKVHARAEGADQSVPADHFWAQPERARIYDAASNVTMHESAVEVLENHGGEPHTNMQPYLAVRFCVALTGLYPQRP